MKKPSLEFLSLSLVLGIIGAIGSLLFFAWITTQVLEGETKHFDDVTRAAVHQFATPTLTATMSGTSAGGPTAAGCGAS